MIIIDHAGGSHLVWNVEDVLTLRQEYRIVGEASGTLPTSTKQNRVLGLPVSLLPEQARLLCEKGLARVVRNCEIDVTAAAVEQFEAERSSELKGTEINSLSQNKRTIVIADAYPVKLPEEININAPVILHTNASRLHIEEQACTLPLCSDERYLVFKELWDKGYFITSGVKFGGDYLLYAGDPSEHHASYIVTVRSAADALSGYELVALSRLANQVKKTVVVAYVDGARMVRFVTLVRAEMDVPPPLREVLTKTK